MQDCPFQASIVGRSSMPNSLIDDYDRYRFLRGMLKNLEEGQAIRLILPKGWPKYRPINYWSRITNRGKGHTRSQKQADGSYILWLWCDK